MDGEMLGKEVMVLYSETHAIEIVLHLIIIASTVASTAPRGTPVEYGPIAGVATKCGRFAQYTIGATFVLTNCDHHPFQSFLYSHRPTQLDIMKMRRTQRSMMNDGYPNAFCLVRYDAGVDRYTDTMYQRHHCINIRSKSGTIISGGVKRKKWQKCDSVYQDSQLQR